MITDPAAAFGYKFKYAFKCFEEIDSDEELVQLVRTQGQRKQIKFQEHQLNIFYYVHFVNEKYIWFFENLEEHALTFKATFTFVLENLAIEGNIDEPNSFKIELGAGK